MSEPEFGRLDLARSPTALSRPVIRPGPFHDGPLFVAGRSGSVRPEPSRHQLRLKRLLDVLLSAACLTFLSPILLLLMALICLESRGSAIFKQRRIGQAGKAFDILKLRTMVDGAEDWLQHLKPINMYADNRLFKIEGDPRVTRLGRILRKTSLDETLQFVNVLRGEMSLVGPRPPLPSEVEAYADHQRERLLVMPGITGPWQVAGRNHISSFEEVVRLERDYIRDWNLGKDLKIILRTIPAVLFMRGAH